MHYFRRPSWWLPESAATPEHVFRNRRAFLAGGAALGALGLAGGGLGAPAHAAEPETPFNPAPPVNPDFADAGRAITPEQINASYNNFYEFGSHKQIYRAAQALETDGWTVTLDGEVEAPQTIAMDDLLTRVALEERVVRHRCVEAWSMVAPWVGFELKALMDIAEPLSGAKYVRFESFNDASFAPGQRAFWYPWPYIEGLTIEEAAHPLTFMVVGAYGKVLHKQFGAPIRLHTPWKYGFKSIKSIVRISFVRERPVSFWEEEGPREYGFWANVNPEVAHPRWSQAQERVLGEDRRVPTLLYNGYGDAVASLYTGLEDEYRDWLYR